MKKLLCLLFVLAGAVACAVPPQADIDKAEVAFTALKERRHCCSEAREAEAAHKTLEAEIALQRDRFFKSYKETAVLAQEVITLCEKVQDDRCCRGVAEESAAPSFRYCPYCGHTLP